MLGHTGNIISEGGGLVTRLGRIEAEELGKSWAVLGVFVNTKLDVLAESRIKLVKLLTIFSDLVEELQGLLDNVLLDDFHNLVLLKGFTRQVQGKVLRVDDTLNEAQPFRDEISGIISDEDSTNVELDVVLGLLRLEQIERCALGNKQNGAELELTLDREVFDGKVILPITISRLKMSPMMKKLRKLTWKEICRTRHTPPK